MDAGEENQAKKEPFGKKTIDEEDYVVVVKGIVMLKRPGINKDQQIRDKVQVYKGDEVYWTSPCNWHFSKS